jgi:hypothetical protein
LFALTLGVAGTRLWAMKGVPSTLVRSWFNSPGKRITVVAFVALLIGGAMFTRVYRFDLKRDAALAFSVHEAEVFYLPPVKVLEAVSLGRKAFMADLLLIRGVSYFINHLFRDRRFPWLNTYLERAYALHPHNKALYEWAMKVVKYRQRITNEVIEESNEWARRGIDAFPDYWKFHMEIGFNHYFEWDFADEEDQAKHQRGAVDHFMIASTLPGSRLDPNFVTNLYLKHNEEEMALFFALQRYHDGSDEEKEMLLHRVASLISDQAARAILDREAAWRENYPYVSPVLFELLGRVEDGRVPLHLEQERSGSELLEVQTAPAGSDRAPERERRGS